MGGNFGGFAEQQVLTKEPIFGSATEKMIGGRCKVYGTIHNAEERTSCHVVYCVS